MDTPPDPFTQHLLNSGRLSSDIFPPVQDGPSFHCAPGNAQELANELVRRQKLTPLQAEVILQGDSAGLVLGSYMILGQIGRGGMGQVYKAIHSRMGRVVALKVLAPALTQKGSAVQRFEREVQAVSRVSHPNIVTAFDADVAKGVHFLVMEYVEGTDLATLVRGHGPLPLGQAIRTIQQAARGLGHVHRTGIVHRDVKPANLIQDAEGTVKVLDLGLARLRPAPSSDPRMTTQADLTDVDSVMGTVDFMAPEQALDFRRADHRADIYGLGCTLYYLLTGKAAYAGDTPMSRLLAHREQAVPSLRRTRAEVPVELDALVQRMMAKRPEDRPRSMEVVLAALAPIAAATPSEPATVGPGTPLARLLENGETLSFEGDEACPLRVPPEQAARLQPPASGPRDSTPKPDGIGRTGMPSGIRWLALVGLAAAVILLAVVVFKVQTTGGTPVVEVGKPEAGLKFRANHQRVEINRGHDPGRLPIQVDPGTPRPDVEKKEARSFPKEATTRIAGLDPQTAVDRSGDPAFVQWMEGVAALPVGDQAAAVAARLKALNPGFDGKVTHAIENGAVTRLDFLTDNVTDISPVRALTGLRRLDCSATWGQGRLGDLSPLKGLKLTHLCCNGTRVSDLSPLKGMNLSLLFFAATPVSDLSPLKGMNLSQLHFAGTSVTDLSPLKGMNLVLLICSETPVTDLSPLEGMPLTGLMCDHTPVSDLSPLKNLPLRILRCDFKPERDAPLLRPIRTLESINDRPAAEFWKEVDVKLP